MRSIQIPGQQRSSEGDRILVDSISHGFGDGAVLSDVSLEVRPGEVLAVIGPSGTGKTTLLELLGLFERPDAGTINLDGEQVWSLSERKRRSLRRRTGMVFQQPALFDASVARNVRYGIHIRKSWRERLRSWTRILDDGPSDDRIYESLETVDMVDQLEQHTGELSGGEAQRVAFARALAYDPDYLFLDEPTSDLDPRNTAVIEQAVDAVCTADTGVVLATHDMHQAERIADRVGVMIDGQLIEVGHADAIFTDPDDPRTQRFIDGELVY